MLQIEDWDKDQLSVIKARHDQRLLVEAGPGTGKTSVACARIGYLIEFEGVTESNIWMISFTRTAVAEIQSRLKSHVGDAAFSVKVATVDSHAWSIHSGHDSTAKLTGTYEENVERVIKLVRFDEMVQDELANVEHLIVDEAQDLIGIRAKLLEELIDQLSAECGVTVFADTAQAIYGFTEDDKVIDNIGSNALVDRLAIEQKCFEKCSMKTIHRTSSLGLKRIFGEVRSSILTGSETPENLFAQTRDSINEHADQTGLKSSQLELDKIPANSLVLFRSRAEALRHSQFCNRLHGLRLSGFGSHLPAWIAICLQDYTDSAISESDFHSRWANRVESTLAQKYGPEEAWERLVRTGGNRDGSVSLKRLRSRLSQSRPPVEICSIDFGLPGPIIGTIHASKGREENNVTLLIPRQQPFDDPALEIEETRILFVGATRAREMLRVGRAEAYSGFNLDGGRAIKPKAKGTTVAMVEIGRSEDLCFNGIAGLRILSQREFLTSQQFLKNHASVITKLKLQTDPERNWRHKIIAPEDNLVIGVTSNVFKNDLWKIAKFLSERDGKRLRPGNTIKHVRALGARTVVVSENDPALETLHPSAIRNGFLLAPMIAAFTNVYFNSY